MESVKLVVEVVRDQLNQLQKDVQALQNQQIKVKVDSSGAEALKQTVTDIKQVGQAAANISKTPVKLNVDTSGISALGEEYKRAVQVIDVNTGEVKSAIDEVALGIGRNAKVLTEYGEDASRVTMKITEDYEKQAQAQDKAMGTAAAAHISQYNREMDSLREHVADLNKQLEASHASQAKFASNMQRGSFDDATRAVKDYYSALTDLSKTQTDISLTPNGWKSASGDWDALAAKLNRATTAFNALTSAENVNSLTDEQQIALKRTMAAEAEKYGLAAEKAANKQAASAAKAAENEANLAAKQEQAAQAAKNQSFAQSKVNQDLSQASWLTKLLGNTLDVIIAKVVAWQVLNAGVATVIRSMREAINTMKEVDKQLTNIAKVSNLTATELNRIGESAYDTASKYGVAADEYLSAVYTFQKAGLGNSAEELGELATKTMLVGDTTAEVASKFLIAANAAWKYNGDVKALSKVVDEADYLNNNYAVSLEDIAEALPIVASTAAQAGLSVEQTMAAITTIVSQTAQSGNRAGTALRAIIMNLAGETGELEDGFKVTEETIKSLNGILQQFAPDAVAAAQAAGTIVDPMRAIAALAQAVQEGVLNSGELFNMVSQLGGKLRANQLNALIEGQETYNKALAGTADAAGTADKEIQTMLGSWEAKTQILQNTWTKFISHLVDTDAVKSALDILTGVIKVLDSGFAEFTVTVAGTVAEFLLLKKAITAIASSNLFNFIINEIAMIATTAGGAKIALADLAALLTNSPIAIVTIAAAALWGIAKASDALTLTYEEQLEIVRDLNDEYEKQFGLGSEYEDLKNRAEELTEVEQRRLEVLEAQRIAAEATLKAEKERAAEMWLNDNSRGNTRETEFSDEFDYSTGGFTRYLTQAEVALRDMNAAVADAEEQYQSAKIGLDGYIDSISEQITKYKDVYDGLINAKDAGIELTNTEKAIVDEYERLAGILGKSVGQQEEAVNREVLSFAEAIENYKEVIAEAKQAGVDLEKTVYGNIDLNNRQVLKWSESTLERYREELESWFDEAGRDWDKFVKDWIGSASTVLGSSEQFDGVEIAFSPMLQTENGAVLLSRDSLTRYINSLIQAAGEGWTTEELLRLDAEGIEQDGIRIKNMIADIGETAIETGEAMHFGGEDGAVAQAFKMLQDSAAAAGVSMRELNDAIKSGTLDELRDSLESAKRFAEGLKATGEATDELEKQCKAVSAALKDFDEYGNLTTDSINNLKDAIPDLVKALYDEEGRLTEAGIAALETANHMDTTRHAVEYLQMVADRLSMQNTINEIKRLQTQALTSAAAAIALNNALKSVGIDDPRMGPAMVARGEFKNLDDYLAHAFGSLGSDIDSYVSKYSTGSKLSSRSSGSSSSKSLTDEELERLKELVAYEKERYDYLEAEGAKRKKLIEQVDRIQDAERGLNKYVKSTANYKNAYAKAQQDINSLTDDELEILQDVSSVESDLLTQEEKKRQLEQESLQNERKLLEQNLAFMEQTKAPVVERVEAYRKEQELLHEEAELLRQSKAYQDGNAEAVAEVVALSTQWWEIQKKINEEIEKPYRSLISYQDKQLELLKAIGASDEEMSEKAQEIYESWVALLETQLASGASQDDLLATVLEIITAKKNWLALEKDLTEEAKKQRELDLKYLSDTAALRKLDIQLAEKLGMSVEEQLAYMQQYADALIAQGKWMEENGASQLEINQLALEYLNIMEEMWELENGKKETTAAEDAHLKFLQDVITLRKGELALMEAMGLSTDQQIEKYRQILEALEAQGEYQKNIGASVADQNETATEYYNTLRKILELEKKQLSELAEAAQELLETERDAATGPLQEQLDLLKKQHDEAKAQREEEEKLLAVEKARDALENAKRQRTVRTYNASAGQWEWVSNAKDVQSAEDALQKAQDALEEYQYQQKIKEIEAQIEAIKESYNGLIEAINEAANGIIDGKYDFQKAYKYITDKMRKLYDKYGIDLTNVMTRATDGFEEVSREIDATYREIETTALTFGDLNATLTEKTDDLSEELEEARAMLELAFGKLGATLDKSDYQLEKSADSLSEVADILSLLPGKLQDLINALLQTASVDDYGGDSGGGSGGGGGSSDDNWGGGGNGAQGEYQHMAEKPDGTKYWITYKDGEPIASTMPIEEGDYVYNSSGTQKWKVSASRAAEMNASIAAYQAANGGGGSGGGSSGGGAGGGGTSSGDSSSGGSTTDDDNHVPSWIDELFPVQASPSSASGNKGSAHSSMLSSSTLGNTAMAGRYGIKGASRQNQNRVSTNNANNTSVVNYNMTIGSWDMRHITEGTTMGEVWKEMRSQARRLGLN